MKRVNESFMVSENADYVLVNAALLHINSGVAHVLKPYAVAQARASGAVAEAWVSRALAEAWVSGAVAQARASGAVAQARASGAVAQAWVSGAVAQAWASGAVAQARASGAVAQAWVSGAVAQAWASGAQSVNADDFADLCECDGYTLKACTNGTYYAGCRGPFTAEQALAHWDRKDDRACLFTFAILMFEAARETS
jgi:transcription elongation factor